MKTNGNAIGIFKSKSKLTNVLLIAAICSLAACAVIYTLHEFPSPAFRSGDADGLFRSLASYLIIAAAAFFIWGGLCRRKERGIQGSALQSTSRMTKSLHVIATLMTPVGSFAFVLRDEWVSLFHISEMASSAIPLFLVIAGFVLSVVSDMRYRKESGQTWTKQDIGETILAAVILFFFFLAFPSIFE
ncbi:MAG: hypothetical protein LBO70_07215 [Clostridiales Family XIII bacterium]|jgi:hypothetical protein|nr:hypothetical protein [Clostridiales Family XIII bacterium]